MTKLATVIIIIIIFLCSLVLSKNSILKKIDSISPVNEQFNDTNQVIDQVNILHQNAQECISRKFYSKASEYYMAILQLLNETGKIDSLELKLKCLNAIAFCDFKTDQFYSAIARCTDIIDEFAVNVTNDIQESVDNLIGKAYYRRGLSFYILGLPNLAIPDMRTASSFLPNDDKIDNKISQIIAEENDIPELDNEDNRQDLQNIIIYSKNLTTSLHKKMNSTEIENLLNGAIKFTNSNMNTVVSNMENMDLGNMNPMSGLGSVGLGGMGGLSSLLGTKGQNFMNFSGIFSQIESFSPLIQKMTGLDSKTLTNIVDIGKAIVNVYKVLSRILKHIVKYSGFVVAITWLIMLVLNT